MRKHLTGQAGRPATAWICNDGVSGTDGFPPFVHIKLGVPMIADVYRPGYLAAVKFGAFALSLRAAWAQRRDSIRQDSDSVARIFDLACNLLRTPNVSWLKDLLDGPGKRLCRDTCPEQNSCDTEVAQPQGIVELIVGKRDGDLRNSGPQCLGGRANATVVDDCRTSFQ